MVVGFSALICPFVVDKMIMKRDFPLCIGITVLLAIMLRDNILSRIEAGVLFAIFIAYTIILVMSALKNPLSADEDDKPMSVPKSLVFILLGGAGIILGGTFTVDSAKFFASAFGMSEMLIGLTVVAVGTSLPELGHGLHRPHQPGHRGGHQFHDAPDLHSGGLRRLHGL